MGNLPSGLEWVVVLIIVILIFGVGRISKVAGELGRGIREFRRGINEGEADKTKTEPDEKDEQDT